MLFFSTCHLILVQHVYQSIEGLNMTHGCRELSFTVLAWCKQPRLQALADRRHTAARPAARQVLPLHSSDGPLGAALEAVSQAAVFRAAASGQCRHALTPISETQRRDFGFASTQICWF